MLALVALEIEARPPSAPVTGVEVSAGPVRAEPGQGGLWSPPSPAFRDLAATLARLAVLVGRANVGSPVIADSHRADAISVEPFRPPVHDDRFPPVADEGHGIGFGFRRLRPPRPIDVETDGEAPQRFRF